MTERENFRRLASKPIPKKVEKALEVVAERRSFLKNFDDFDDFIFRGEDVNRRAAAAIEHNLRLVRTRLARILWSNEVFIGINIIDQLLFDIAKSEDASTLIPAFLTFIQEKKLHRAGFVLYPLHSFGVLGLGFFRYFRKSLPYMTLQTAGLCITAQTNTTSDTFSFLNHVREAFGIPQRLPTEVVEHFIRSRPLHWIERNPLMAVRVRSLTGTYYENQFIYMLKLRMSTALVMMLSVMEDRTVSDKRLVHGSSTRVNNWQTLDIKHYLTFETPGSRRSTLTAYCIPMHTAQLELALLSDLNVNIDPVAWGKTKARRRLSQLTQTIATVEKGFFEHSMLGDRNSMKGRVYRKLVTSIEAFRRSLSAGVRHTEAVVSLAIAFETLLTDHYAPGVKERIARRVALYLRGVPGTRRYQETVSELFDCRGAIVHQGTTVNFSGMRTAHQAYVLCLQHIVPRLEGLPVGEETPIAHVLGDKNRSTP